MMYNIISDNNKPHSTTGGRRRYYNYRYFTTTTTTIIISTTRCRMILLLLVLLISLFVRQNDLQFLYCYDASIKSSSKSLSSSLFIVHYVTSFQLLVPPPPPPRVLYRQHHQHCVQQNRMYHDNQRRRVFISKNWIESKYQYPTKQKHQQHYWLSKVRDDDDSSSSSSGGDGSTTATTTATTSSNETSLSLSSVISTPQQTEENSSSTNEITRSIDPIDDITTKDDNNNNNNENENDTIHEEIIYEFQLHGSINEIDEEDWNRCISGPSTGSAATQSTSSSSSSTGTASPFLLHSWLRCLEDTGCVSAKTGWVPQHISIYEQKRKLSKYNKNTTTISTISNDTTTLSEEGGRLCGVIPMYIKGNSFGEFIFDQSFANAAYQMGIRYYPKLLIAIPFTPATASKFNYYGADRTNTNDIETTIEGRQRRQYSYNRAIGEFIKHVAKSNGISSVHVNFITDQEATDLAGPLVYPNADNNDDDDTDDYGGIIGTNNNKNMALLRRLLFGKRNPEYNNADRYLRRTSLQYHWENTNPFNDGKPFTSFEDYLACFKSKKRINIKRERRMVLVDQNITIHIITGQDIIKYNTASNKKFIYRMYQIYVSTIEKMSIWGRQYLSYDFFQRIIQTDFVNYLVFICASKKRNPMITISSTTTTNTEGGTNTEPFYPEDVFAGTINIVKDNVFYGRYWGCLRGKDIKNLHFETCYWSAIDYCIQNGIQRMEPGAGGGDYKWARGFNPSLIHSVHYICDPNLRRMINQFLQYETEDNIELTEYLRSKSSVGSSNTTPKSS